MNLKHAIIAAAMSLAATAASATVITFTGLTTQYGDGNRLASSMTATAKSLSYTESGYIFTLFTPNASPFNAHIGDVGGANTFNWHDGIENGVGAYVTITKVDGGLFNLNSFNYFSGGGITVSATGNSNAVLSGRGVANLNFLGVSSATFSSARISQNQIDNVNLTSVPEPASLALFAAGFGLLGFARRRKA